MKNKITLLISGVVLGVLSVFLFQFYNKFLVISENENILDLSINVLSNLITIIFSTVVAFLVASFQIEQEKKNIAFQAKNENKNIKKEEYHSNIRYLNILKHECEINRSNVNKAIEHHDVIPAETLLKTLDNIFSMRSWDFLYLKIDVSRECYEGISKLYREFRKIKGTFLNEFEVIQLKKLSTPLNDAITLINLEIATLDSKIKDL